MLVDRAKMEEAAQMLWMISTAAAYLDSRGRIAVLVSKFYATASSWYNSVKKKLADKFFFWSKHFQIVHVTHGLET